MLGPALVVFALMGAQIPWAGAYEGFKERRAERAAMAPLLAEAQREALSFPQVVVAHPAHMGKVVLWDVARVAAVRDDAVYLDYLGRP